MSRWPGEFLRSTVFRVSLLNALLLGFAIGGALAVAWFATRSSVEQGARERIAIEVEAIASELDKEGAVGAAAAVNWRSARPGALVYLLVGADGRVLAGDMTAMPRAPGWHRFHMPGTMAGGSGEDERALTVRQRDGANVGVGEDLSRSEAVRAALFGAILPTGAIALLLGLAASILITRRVLRRMEGIVATVRSVEAGDLSARVPRAEHARDDVEELGVAINQMLDRIATLVGAVRRVSAEIAHDLRTPLTHAQHALDTARWSEDDATRNEAIDAANANMARALRLFEAMLALAEIDSGIARVNFTELDLAAIVEQVVDAYRPDIEASGRTIECHAGTVAPILGDADLLTQAVANLIDNALKHSRNGARIAVSVVETADGASACVADDGPGVDPKDAETILRPFGRLDEARSTPGNGLGLAIVDGVAVLHGGSLDIRHLSPGLAISLRVPVHPAGRSPAGAARHQGSPGKRAGRGQARV